MEKRSCGGLLDGLDSKPSAGRVSSPFDVENGKICSRLLGFGSDHKPAIFPHVQGRAGSLTLDSI